MLYRLSYTDLLRILSQVPVPGQAFALIGTEKPLVIILLALFGLKGGYFHKFTAKWLGKKQLCGSWVCCKGAYLNFTVLKATGPWFEKKLGSVTVVSQKAWIWTRHAVTLHLIHNKAVLQSGKLPVGLVGGWDISHFNKLFNKPAKSSSPGDAFLSPPASP